MRRKGCFRIHGRVQAAGSREGLPGLRIQALDKDLIIDDRLGEAVTDANGRFELRYTVADFADFFDLRPDIYLRVLAADGAVLLTTEDRVRYEASDTEEFLLALP